MDNSHEFALQFYYTFLVIYEGKIILGAHLSRESVSKYQRKSKNGGHGRKIFILVDYNLSVRCL